ncbi:RND family efflux transporter MFP subunit [Yersinia massiliensis]|uniref:darobactin export ABC transporter periplasmic adaptor subunit n=1 Tax=Yersinia massiliensis TaxID=419257 RepID=UPI0005E45497|nr:darobactin export ABC transporter periplasmic adaptor subunit [Yersinia massiliensis]CNH84111.1 RND family efflux transporter MFP subunit [Yersinia massiliensis]
MDIKIENKPVIRNNNKVIIFCVLCILTTCLLFIYRLSTTETSLLVSRSNVTFYVIEPEIYQDTLLTRAVAVPQESIIVSSEYGGKVIEIVKPVFEEVLKGDVIARLSNYDLMLKKTSRIAEITEQINNLRNMKMHIEQNNRDAKISLHEAQHNIEVITKNLARYQSLDKKSLIARSEVETQLDLLKHWKVKQEIFNNYNNNNDNSAPSQFKSIENTITRLEELMSLIDSGTGQLVITAPIDGTISMLDIELGQQLKPGAKIATIDNLKSYYFNVDFSEYYLDKIKPKSHIYSNINGKDTRLLIESVSTLVENGKFKAKLIPIEYSVEPLKRGQSIEIKIPLQESNTPVLTVPIDSIVKDKYGNNFLYIYQEKSDHAIKTKVEVKRKNTIKAEIISGLTVGDRIVMLPEIKNTEHTIIGFK